MNDLKHDYSNLNTHYEADTKRYEIIEWNKDNDNAKYRNLEKIAELLNHKQLQIEQQITQDKLLNRIKQLEQELDFYQTDRKLLVRRIEEVKTQNLTLELENIKLRETYHKQITKNMEDTE